jgi:type I restriction enzyme S subunit
MKVVGKIKDACIVIAGQSPSGASYNDNGVGMEFHQGKKAFGESFIEHSNVWTTEITKIAEPGDILMSVRAPVGPTNLTDRKICIGRGLAAIRCNKTVIPAYILYALRNIESEIIGNDGAVFNSINKKQIEELPLPLLSLSEQQSIIDYLDSAFAKIDAMKANAEKALNEAKALFQASLKEMLEPKEGWEEKTLGELSDKIGDGLHGTPKYTDDGEFFFVNGNNLENGIIEMKDNTKRVNHDEYEKYKLDLNSSTVLLSINGTIGKTAFYNGEPIILGKSACYINVLPTLLKEYLRYYLVSDGFFNYVKSNSRQATITNLGLKEIRKMPLPTPSLDEQQFIVATLDSLKSKVDRLQANFEKISQECDALKQAILRQVFE